VLPPAFWATSELERAVGGASFVAMGVPSHAFRQIFRALLPFLGSDAPVVSLSKGIEQDTMKRMSEILEEEGSIGPRRIAVLSGPTWPRRW